MQVIITSPSLDTKLNVSGISSVTKFITAGNKGVEYIHFEVGKRDNESSKLAWLFRILRTYYRWPILLLRKNKALIHFNLAVDKFGVLRDGPLLLFAKALKRQTIIHLHGGEYLTHKVPPEWMSGILRLVFAGKTPVIVLSITEAEIIRNRFNCRNVFVLPNCVDLTFAKSFHRECYDGELKILFIGRISKAKGLEYIYLTFKNLKEQGHSFEFSLAGKGPDEQEYIEKFTKTLGEAFKFYGVVDGNQKIELIQKNTVFLLPSFFEGLPISLLECMAFGLIPIATPVGSIPDIINHGENGYLVKLKSIEEIVKAIKQLENDIGHRAKLSRNAKQSIFQNYNPDRYFNALNEIYHYEQDHQLSFGK